MGSEPEGQGAAGGEGEAGGGGGEQAKGELHGAQWWEVFPKGQCPVEQLCVADQCQEEAKDDRQAGQPQCLPDRRWPEQASRSPAAERYRDQGEGDGGGQKQHSLPQTARWRAAALMRKDKMEIKRKAASPGATLLKAPVD